MTCRLRPGFIDGAAGRIHVSVFRPAGDAHASAVVAQPFAEEANKARRMVALLARAVAARGMVVYVPDYHGTGDSEGDFAEARWALWREDLRRTAALAAEQEPGPTAVLGIRLGAILAAEVVSELPEPAGLSLWQPVLDGDQALTQFLRLRTAASMMADQRETVSELRGVLDGGEAVEVAGYTIAPELAQALRGARLPVPAPAGTAHWFWLSTAGTLPPPLEKAREQWGEAGWSVQAEALTGDAFWSTQEIATVPELVDRTAEAMLGGVG